MNIEQLAFNGTIDPKLGKELIGAVGNEQHSTGAHLHMQSDVEGNPVNLFAWADAHRNGILAQSDVQNLYFKFNAELGVLVNQDNKLILQRKVEDADGVNTYYAWTGTLNKDNQTTWVRVKWNADVGFWCRWNETTNSWFVDGNNKKKWVLTDHGYDFENL